MCADFWPGQLRLGCKEIEIWQQIGICQPWLAWNHLRVLRRHDREVPCARPLISCKPPDWIANNLLEMPNLDGSSSLFSSCQPRFVEFLIFFILGQILIFSFFSDFSICNIFPSSCQPRDFALFRHDIWIPLFRATIP